MSQQHFLPFALPDIGEEEINEVVNAMRSGWVTTGPKTKQFEADFAQWLGGGVEAIAVNSATSGLHLALEALGIGPGDEVITTAYTFTASAEVMRYLGAHPVLVDIDPNTLNIDPARIEAAITPRTKAIMPVHFAGLGCDMQAILAIARKHNLKVVEDAAHALPTRVGGELVGKLASDVTVFSFYATKTITTGEGGMVVCRDADIAKRCRLMRLHGINRDAFDRYTSNKPSWYYEIVAPGFKYNLSDVASAMGIHQLRKADVFQQQRQQMADRYSFELADLPLLLPPGAPAGDLHAWHLYVLRLSDAATVSRDDFIQAMFDRGIGCSVHFIPLHLHPYWRDTYKLQPSDFPKALDSFQRAISLPLYTKMTSDDQARVIDAVRAILTGN
ncbi:UDP-4-amino-4,6-dideoxy-N-acetyl-beta-L-altrosamine transaminase [Limnohabitans sp. JirII-29]|uniref:DegT/DnrJ/EryC1/StrS family aminotransferase n=1 Tax=Limnohabitans sp. JirII-29 TaxID=1835756 RepID=UPI000D33639A|nr:DegT/DnrJ/EryC1/StrS family aminotransferase [Limnohabitans sp. JirII-29]PUE29113.1 UDP-4-amino-4,6-dideoxy-N-acetyl-beta-L-altrosamine transaminase [Limnohabitans sp. JirII-29]